MITREQIHELAQFEDQAACALSFYFQPTAPRNKAHKEEAILTKDLAREVLRQLESKSNSNGKRTQIRVGPRRSRPHRAPVAGFAWQRRARQGGIRLRGAGFLARV